MPPEVYIGYGDAPALDNYPPDYDNPGLTKAGDFIIWARFGTPASPEYIRNTPKIAINHRGLGDLTERNMSR